MIRKISFIGAGNVASQLAIALSTKNFIIEDIFSRDLLNASQLADKIGTGKPTNDPDLGASEAELFILSIKDQAVPELLQRLKLPNHAKLVHTSGTLARTILDSVCARNAVFYPLQTFTKNKPVDFGTVNLCIETEDEDLAAELNEIAQVLTPKVFRVSAEDRLCMHVAAVIACNFCNHLLARSEEVLKQAGLPLHVLEALVRETVDKAFDIGPQRAQTGPAVRQDHEVIQKHIHSLSNKPELAELYEKLSADIIRLHHGK